MARASLALQFTNLGLLKSPGYTVEDIENLEAFKTKALLHDEFTTIDEALLNEKLIEEVMEKIHQRSYNSEEIFLMAYALSHYGFSSCHTTGYKETTPLNIHRFENVYGLARKLYELKKDEEERHRLEMAELLYNGFRGLELKKESGLEAAHKHLDEAVLLNPSLEMQARVANFKACDWYEKDINKSAELMKVALTIREKIPLNEQDPFLLATARNNFCSLILKTSNPDLEEADNYISLAVDYAEARRGLRDDAGKVINPNNEHQYFGLYDINMAALRLKQERLEDAALHIDRAFETFGRHLETSNNFLERAAKIKSEIREAAQ